MVHRDAAMHMLKLHTAVMRAGEAMEAGLRECCRCDSDPPLKLVQANLLNIDLSESARS